MAGDRIDRLFRYSLASIGPIGSAGAQFLLSVALLRLLSPASFGSFSFLIASSQFAQGLWSALFCAPLLVVVTQRSGAEAEAAARSLMASNAAAAFVAGLVFAGAARALECSWTAASLSGLYAALALLRWFARARSYALGTPLRTMASDLVYSLTLLTGIAVLLIAPIDPTDSAFAVLLAAAVAGLLPFGLAYLRPQFGSLSFADIGRYRAIWREHSGWSLLGVLTTEITVNCHTYIVTFLYGPAAFAPIAASALLMRPITVAVNALLEYERAQLARQIGERRFGAVLGTMRLFRFVLIAVWAATALAAAALMLWAPNLLFHGKYPLGLLAVGVSLFMGVALVRLFHAPESAFLQAAGAFRPLAWASVYTSGLSLMAVLALLALGGPIWSIGGIIVGEGAFAAWLWIAARRWLDRAQAPR